MEQAAEELRFETAARLRDKIYSLQQVQQDARRGLHQARGDGRGGLLRPRRRGVHDGVGGARRQAHRPAALPAGRRHRRGRGRTAHRLPHPALRAGRLPAALGAAAARDQRGQAAGSVAHRTPQASACACWCPGAARRPTWWR